jgi:hypothetical protein
MSPNARLDAIGQHDALTQTRIGVRGRQNAFAGSLRAMFERPKSRGRTAIVQMGFGLVHVGWLLEGPRCCSSRLRAMPRLRTWNNHPPGAPGLLFGTLTD